MTRLPYPLALALALALTPPAFAADTWILASQGESLTTGQTLTLDVVKPDSQNDWPQTLQLKLSGSGISETLDLTLQPAANSTSARRQYAGLVRSAYKGVVRADLVNASSNRILLVAADGDSSPPMQVVSASQANQPAAADAPPKLVIAKPGEEPALTANDPIYFLLGSNDERGEDARFQISFKYRPFAPDGAVADFAPFLTNLYFGYTQTTIWDIGEKSSPFRDTSYRPSLFYEWGGSGRGLMPDDWRGGVEHESNGQGGVDSRSINTAFVRPAWHWAMPSGRSLSFMPKIYEYLDKEDGNSDIQRYRGYVDWQVRYGREDGLMLNGLYRQGTAGYSTGQVDVTYPISDKIFNRTGAFIHLQVFSGYGETLLGYNRDSDTQIRLGLSLTR
ncbi:phospholipase A [Methylovorus sp. MP688]|uniref:phospholipase A n=1 Tax=Methylovorus sp. (strain MP688) TaxID=887061 RepID=UPI0001EC46E7|nr:phospholipase A [Methylovorus sp. MP688]ADQ84550.1 putative phospholipase [Methylovorus sp. MP688]